MRVLTLVALAWAGAISSGCKEGSTSQAPDAVNETPGTPPLSGSETSPGGGPTRFQASKVTELSEPWAMTFLPDGRLLVTERRGSLKRVSAQGDVETVTGVPTVAYGGQGGLGDVILHPAFGSNGLVYLSWAEGGSGGSYGAVVGRAKFVPQGNGGRLENVEV
ncbi:MAG TPA: PQQ-dependent sugar dehydrogenase, partial [Myxococcaceae bacterium]|nr:PQQ-dependent sugar dehydrogenase [Myxococcaceae bacterium]